MVHGLSIIHRMNEEASKAKTINKIQEVDFITAHRIYKSWLINSNWKPQPSFLYWWYAAENPPNEHLADWLAGMQKFRKDKEYLFGGIFEDGYWV